MKDNFDVFFEKEHLMLRDEVRNFVKKELPPDFINKIEHDPEITYPFEIRNKLRKLDLTTIGIPAEYGGTPLSHRANFLVFEELAKASMAVAFTAALMGQWGSTTLVKYGSEEQKRKYLPEIAKGNAIWSVAMTESGSGSDLMGYINTTAVESGDYWVINGEKNFITGAHICDHLMVLAKTDPDNPNKQARHSIIIVDGNEAGVTATPIPKMTVKPVASNVLNFNNVKVPKDNLVGKRGQGFYHLLPLLNGHRLIATAEALGVAQSAYADATEYAKTRIAFGKPIGQFQLQQKKLVDMETEIRAAKLLGYHAAWLADHQKSYMMECLISQRYASEIGFKTATHALEMFGGYGFAQEYNVERYFRDSRQSITTPFTNDIMLTQIAGLLGFKMSY